MSESAKDNTKLIGESPEEILSRKKQKVFNPAKMAPKQKGLDRRIKVRARGYEDNMYKKVDGQEIPKS